MGIHVNRLTIGALAVCLATPAVAGDLHAAQEVVVMGAFADTRCNPPMKLSIPKFVVLLKAYGVSQEELFSLSSKRQMARLTSIMGSSGYAIRKTCLDIETLYGPKGSVLPNTYVLK